MTLDKFFEKLEQTPRDWHYWEHGTVRAIRCVPCDDQQCPLSSLADLPVYDWDSAAMLLKISDAMALRIIRAADGDKGHSPALRQRLLKACGLA